MTRTLVACLLVSLAPQAQPTSQTQMCGVVTSYSTTKLEPAGCDLRLMVKPPDAAQPFGLVIEDAVRRQIARQPWDYFHQDICVTGAPTPDRPAIVVSSPSQIDVKWTGAAPTFGAGAVSMCDATLTSPRLVKEVKPSYTGDAMRARVEGVVTMDVVVDTDGTVSDARVTRPVHPDLDEQALVAVRQWQFTPGTRDGKPVRVIVAVDMTFTIAKKGAP